MEYSEFHRFFNLLNLVSQDGNISVPRVAITFMNVMVYDIPFPFMELKKLEKAYERRL